MSLRHILTCLVISSVLATVAESKPVAANGAQVERQFWQPISTLQQHQPYIHTPSGQVLQSQPSWSSRSDIYSNSHSAGFPLHPFLRPVPQVPNELTPSRPFFKDTQPSWSAGSPDVIYTQPAAFPQYPFFQTYPQVPNEITPVVYTTTSRPFVKDTEPTTERGFVRLDPKPAKTQNSKQQHFLNFQNDANLLSAVRNINHNFVIEDIIPVPGKRVYSETDVPSIGPLPSKSVRPEKLQTFKKNIQKSGVNQSVKVEATGNTATSGVVPEIPFETYFLPYLSQQSLSSGTKPASLILEPHAKAVVGNGGTAISTPISRAVLKRGMPTNVYFNPESVAIAGVGGKAHAQADLELDLMNRRR